MGVRDIARRRLLLDWDQRVTDWSSATSQPRPALKETTIVLQDLLEKQLDRATSAVAAIDTKAALVIPSVGVITTVVVGHVADATRDSLLLTGVLAGVVALATLAVLLSLLCLAPSWQRSNGPQPLPVVLASGEDELRVRLGYVNQLGFAVQTAEMTANAKAQILNWGIRAGALGTILLVVDLALGGLK